MSFLFLALSGKSETSGLTSQQRRGGEGSDDVSDGEGLGDDGDGLVVFVGEGDHSGRIVGGDDDRDSCASPHVDDTDAA